jgi:hypothetical protein
MKTRAWNPPSLRFGATRMEDGGWNPRSVLECGDWRGTGLAPLWNESSARMNPAHVKAACALTPHPPQSKTWRMFGALLTFLAITISVRAQNYSIDWYKIAGGGGTSTGGVYSVSGTLGQPDAGTMSGGNFTLEGGFWGIIAAVQTPGAPWLTITRTATNSVVVSWANTGSYTLQTNNNLATSNWNNYGGTVNTANSTNSVTVTPPTGNLFFRLKQ